MSNSAPISIEAFREQWLADVREGKPSTVELGRRFAHKLVTQWRDVDDASSDLVYCDGAGDGGIDVAYLDRGDDEGATESNAVGHSWYLVQSKYGSAFQGTTTLLQEGQKVIDTLDGKRTNLSSLAEGLLERLITFRNGSSEHDRIVLLFATEGPLDASQKQTLDDLRAMGRNRLGALFEVESLSIQTIYERTLEDAEAIALKQRTVPLNADLFALGSTSWLVPRRLSSFMNFLRRIAI